MSLVNKLLEYLHGYKVTYLMMCAAEWKLFDELIEPTTAVEVARRLKLNTESTEIALNIFAGLGLIIKNDANYEIEPSYKELLVSESNQSILSLFVLEKHLLIHHNTISTLKDAWQTGKGRDSFNENGKEGVEQTYGKAMDNGGQLASLYVARIFSKLNKGKILDLGGGMGTYSEAICRLNKDINVDIYDCAEMEKVCMGHLKQAGFADRVTFKRKNILTDPIDDSCEGILISNVLHLFTMDENKRLLQKCAQVLKPKGIIVIHDFFLNDNHTGDIASLLFSIDWMLIGSNFHMSLKDLERCVENLDLKVLDWKQYESLPTSIIVLEKMN